MNQDPYTPPPQWPEASAEALAAQQSHADTGGPGADAKPRVWPVLTVLVACFCTYLLATMLTMLLATWIVHEGPVDAPFFGEHGRLAVVTKSPLGLTLMLLLPQIALAVPALLAAIASPVPLAQRLGLVRGTWPIWMWCTAAMATPLVGMISSVIVRAVLGESETLDEMADVFRSLGQEGYLIPLALLVGITPGICEELVFRGYVQTRLTSAWGAPLGILSASLVFAAFHMNLVHSVAVIAIGVYLGWVAWASGSILTAMVAHFLNNFLSVLAVVLLPKSTADGVPTDVEAIPPVAMIALGCFILISGVCLVVTLLNGIRRSRSEILSDSGNRILPS